QFLGALHQRVRGQDLFDQRGAGTRQADYEDGIGRREPRRRPLREELPCEHPLRARYVARGLLGVVAHQLAAQRVAARVLIERRRVFAHVFERLAEREMEMEAVVVGEIFALDLRTHGGDVIGREAEGLEVRETPPYL